MGTILTSLWSLFCLGWVGAMQKLHCGTKHFWHLILARQKCQFLVVANLQKQVYLSIASRIQHPPAFSGGRIGKHLSKPFEGFSSGRNDRHSTCQGRIVRSTSGLLQGPSRSSYHSSNWEIEPRIDKTLCATEFLTRTSGDVNMNCGCAELRLFRTYVCAS